MCLFQLTVLQGTAHHSSEVKAAGMHPQMEIKEPGYLYSTPILHLISPGIHDLGMVQPTDKDYNEDDPLEECPRSHFPKDSTCHQIDNTAYHSEWHCYQLFLCSN